MVLALPVLAAIAIGLALGGQLGRLAALRVRAAWLVALALALQVIAFPFPFLPWSTGETAAAALWLVSYALLGVVAFLNLRVAGVPVVATGMASNAAAVAANGGTMPVLPDAMEAAGYSYTTLLNSTATAEPNLPWLVDRWAAPDWLPLANVFSVGDVVIAAGTFLLVVYAMDARLPRSLKRRDASR